MRVVKLLTLTLTCGLIAAMYACQSTPPTNAPQAPAPTTGAVAGLPANAWQIPCDASQPLCNQPAPSPPTQAQYNEMAWTSFIAVNWPALANQRGAPDTSKTIGATGPDGMPLRVVWETYKAKAEVFKPDGSAPAGWNAAEPLPAGCKNVTGVAKVLPRLAKSDDSNADELIDDDSLNEATDNPLIDQNLQYVRFEVRLNQSEFTYIASGAGDTPKGPGNLYYNSNNQLAAFKPGAKFNDPPKGPEQYVIGGGDFGTGLPPYAQQGAIEIKAAWKVLDPKKDVAERFFRTNAYAINRDGSCSGPVPMGLVGLHILRLTPTTGPTWYWASFEQVDNVDISDPNAPKRPDGSPLTPSFNPGPSGTPAPPYNSAQYPGFCYGTPCGPAPAGIPQGSPLPTPTTPVNVSRLTPIADDINALNQKYRAMLKGTVWQYYQLIAVLNPNTTGTNPPDPKCAIAGQPTVFPNICLMANTTMETYSQNTSCVTCHQYATPIGGQIPANQIFTFLLADAGPPTPTPTPTPASAKPPPPKPTD
jgi:hypothetical protein